MIELLRVVILLCIADSNSSIVCSFLIIIYYVYSLGIILLYCSNSLALIIQSLSWDSNNNLLSSLAILKLFFSIRHVISSGYLPNSQYFYSNPYKIPNIFTGLYIIYDNLNWNFQVNYYNFFHAILPVTSSLLLE